MAPKNPSANELLERAYALESDEEAKELYSDWAETYDETMLSGLGYLTPAKTAKLLSDFVEDRSAKILDVGCGTGLAGRELADRGFVNLDALDYSAEMLAVAAKRNIYSEFHQVDLTQIIPLKAACYDALICTGTFTHAHVGASCFDELFRILKTGGIFACTIHNDVWEPAGFKTKVGDLENKSEIVRRFDKQDIYFENSKEPEGAYLIWEKLK